MKKRLPYYDLFVTLCQKRWSCLISLNLSVAIPIIPVLLQKQIQTKNCRLKELLANLLKSCKQIYLQLSVSLRKPHSRFNQGLQWLLNRSSIAGFVWGKYFFVGNINYLHTPQIHPSCVDEGIVNGRPILDLPPDFCFACRVLISDCKTLPVM